MSKIIPAEIIAMEFTSVASVMAQLGFHRNRQSFLEFVHREEVPHVRLSRKVIVFDKNSVNRWLASRVVPAAAEGSAK